MLEAQKAGVRTGSELTEHARHGAKDRQPLMHLPERLIRIPIRKTMTSPSTCAVIRSAMIFAMDMASFESAEVDA